MLKVGINVGTIEGGGTGLLHQQEPLLTGLGIYPLEFNAGHSLDPLVSLHLIPISVAEYPTFESTKKATSFKESPLLRS